MNIPFQHLIYWPDPQERYVVACSGGIDSVVLLHILHHKKIAFVVAHVNYGLRGDESHRDEQFVRSLCEYHHWPLEVLRVDPNSKASSDIQSWARDIRYTFLRELKHKMNAAKIITAHHLDDQLETILIQYLRGGGISALKGMEAYGHDIIRPLLAINREAIRDFALSNAIEWVEDSSNAKTDYTRNFLRHEVIPMLEKIQPALAQTMSKQAVWLSEANEVLDSYAADFIRNEIQNDQLSITTLNQSKAPRHIVWKWLKSFGFSSAQMDQLLLLEQSGSAIFSPTHVVLRDRDYFILSEKQTTTHLEIPLNGDEGALDTDFGSLSWSLGYPDTAFPSGKNEIWLSSDLNLNACVVRSWRQGDRFVPFGMSGSKLISDYLIAEKISVIDKSKVLVLCHGEQILWILGLRASELTRVERDQKPVWIVRWKARM